MKHQLNYHPQIIEEGIGIIRMRMDGSWNGSIGMRTEEGVGMEECWNGNIRMRTRERWNGSNRMRTEECWNGNRVEMGVLE